MLNPFRRETEKAKLVLKYWRSAELKTTKLFQKGYEIHSLIKEENSCIIEHNLVNTSFAFSTEVATILLDFIGHLFVKN